MTGRRRITAAVSMALAVAGSQAAAPRHTVAAVPFYTPAALVQGAYRDWYVPRAGEFAQAAVALEEGLRQFCGSQPGGTLPAARQDWHTAVVAWDRLAAVSVGPLVQRRSARQIDFAPTRPALIERGLAQAPDSLRALERIGTPAKGFPALEWLLWVRPLTPATPSCRYAVLLAREISAEAAALSGAFRELAARDWKADEAAAGAAMGELLNQWVGGLERLRWAQMEKPLRSAKTSDRPAAPAFPRGAADGTAASWRAQWEALRSLAVSADGTAPAPGAGLVPLELYLRGRGLNPLADRLAAATATAGRGLHAATPARTAQVLDAAKALNRLKQFAEAEVAPALEVQIGFSDSDGD